MKKITSLTSKSPMSMVAWKVAMQQLLDGKEAKDVIAEMWNTYTTLQSMDKHGLPAALLAAEFDGITARFAV